MKLNLNGGSLIWLRRDLRIMENDLVKHAILKSKKLAFCFVFDHVILDNIKSSPFSILDRKSLHVDRRLGFIYLTLSEIKKKLQEFGSDLLIFQGDPVEVIPKAAETVNAGCVLW
ncbi:deoxyribodipyrimidine photo-lyase, partial [Betaproteobacteria bacterium]|nr:deoxyribodipyrimidine photo-lyase [Betaproteobacteria bacterium]